MTLTKCQTNSFKLVLLKNRHSELVSESPDINEETLKQVQGDGVGVQGDGAGFRVTKHFK